VVAVPDAEAKARTALTDGKVKLTRKVEGAATETPVATVPRKRQNLEDLIAAYADSGPAKRPKKSKTDMAVASGLRVDHTLQLVGTLWDSENRLCAYDSVLVPLFHTLRIRSQDFSIMASRLSPHMARFADGVQSLLLHTSQFQLHLNKLCDCVRDDVSLATRSDQLLVLGSLWPTDLCELWIHLVVALQTTWP